MNGPAEYYAKPSSHGGFVVLGPNGFYQPVHARELANALAEMLNGRRDSATDWIEQWKKRQ